MHKNFPVRMRATVLLILTSFSHWSSSYISIHL
jgi:hypothetical protein